MADAIPFSVFDAAGVPVSGVVFTRYAWNAVSGAPRTAPPVVERSGFYELQPTDDDVAVGTVVLVDAGPGPSPGYRERYFVFGVSGRSNQFFAWVLTANDGTLWPGTGGVITGWTGPTTPDVVKLADGVFVAVPSPADIAADASGRAESPAGALPEFVTLGVDSAAADAPAPVPASSAAPGTITVFSSSAYARMQRALLPPGRLWAETPELDKLFRGAADELVRVNQRGADLLEESDPRTATETLPDWEKMLGLPNAIVPVLPLDAPSRRVVVTQAMAAQGGQNDDYFTQVCAACGYPLVSIERGSGRLLRVVTGRVLDRLWGRAYAFHIFVTVGPAGVGALTHVQFEAAFRKRLYAGITASFTYT